MKSFLAVSTAMLCLAPATHAQEREAGRDETIVVTGTRNGDFAAKSGIPLDRVPQGIQILDDEDLVERGVRSVGDALRAVPSANVGGSRVSRYQSAGLKIRGFAADQMRNGIRQRYYEDVDASALSNIARIEVLKGPSAVLYGQSGVGGILSIITRRPTDTPQAMLALTGGMFGQKMATIDASMPLSGTLGIRVTGEVERSGTFVEHQSLNRENLGITLAWRPSAAVSAHLVAEYVRRTTVNNPGLPVVGTVRCNGVGTVRRGAFLGEPDFTDLVADAPLVQAWVAFDMGAGWSLTPRFQYSEFNTSLDQVRLLGTVPGQPTRIQRNGRRGREEDRYTIAQLDLTGGATTFGIRHDLLFGIEHSAERPTFRQFDIVAGDIAPIGVLSPVYSYAARAPRLAFSFHTQGKVDGFAAYAQDQIGLSDAWSVVAGVRHSSFDYENRRTTPTARTRDADTIANTTWQLGMTLRLGGGWSLFGGYNKGFDIDPVVGSRSRAGAPFRPETSDQVEAGLRLIRDRLRASLSAFRIRRNAVAVTDPIDVNFQVQEGQLRVQGVEAEGEWTPVDGWWLQGGYAYLDGRVTRTTTPTMQDARLGDTPDHSATASTRVALGPVELRGGAYHVGQRRLVNGSPVVLDSYTLFDLGLGTDIGPVRIDVALTNVADTTYYTANGGANFVYPGDPRMLSVRLGYALGGGR
ncbi:TonB-dependent siderophore receptor [Sphingomonas sp. 2R-10]|uniref:TonB-dependent receptor n=1 Tax=Sphingomonas sp. 2R-10 TaxID=3045148 RepID=UPI000F76BC25|nr:TonB-dependent siderophore receptor [Sphingomonas sp. 2R-10]MDJ0275518.1 TonB-dependent siderophore receptor [Sphingomonas sp. 2R-10]